MRARVNQPGGVGAADRLGLESLVTGAELRRLLNVSDRTLRRLVSSGAIPRPDVTLGTVRRWKMSTVRCMLGQTETQAVRPRLAVGR